MKPEIPHNPSRLPLLFFLARLIMLVSLPLDGLRGYGDLTHFYRLARLGWPFLDFWVEFPPVFPFLSKLLALIAGGREHVYDYLLILLLTLVQTGELAVFLKINARLHPGESSGWRVWVFFTLLLVLPYGWWYFDPLASLCLMLGIWYFLERKDALGSLAIAAGGLLKLFPVVVLPAVWKSRSPKQSVILGAVILVAFLVAYGGLWLLSPELTGASLRSQVSKGSWETVWALLDGNLSTGNFGPLSERSDPASAQIARGRPAVIPAWLSLVVFLALGFWTWRRARLESDLAMLRFVGFTLCLLFLWSPGWSPQWLLFLLPLVLLALPEGEGALSALVFVLVNIVEWPVLLSRGYNWGLWFTIPLRTFLLILIAYQFLRHNPNERITINQP
ncbi:MAG: hypothetical protein PHS96_14085 [Anaerolineales bacterium]|nr:hypothetical protein [Anaerolineales bacterium]